MRIRLAYLFDPYLAIHTSRVEPLPHQITAVYGEMLRRQPLRFLLADDPGAGKTIMTGLLIKELMIRGDLERCLVVAPGNLVEQWQDELFSKFGLSFSILSRDQLETSSTGNPFEDQPLLIARLDMLSRNEELRACLAASQDHDLIVVDEAHKMSASYTGGEVKYTKRYRLGEFIGEQTRHFLLLSATPHNGKQDDFELFMALLDGDRFEGRSRGNTDATDAGDMMRRLVKEELLRFDGKPLFPERRAYTVRYALSNQESALYDEVTDYVRDEMNRAERFAAEDDRRRVNVGFALQILQRRLASSPEAIYRSLQRRRERLETRLAEESLAQVEETAAIPAGSALPRLTPEFFEDLEDAPNAEIEEVEGRVLDQATAARTVAELRTEISTLERLEARARAVRYSGEDAKWSQLNTILDDPLMVGEDGNRRKLIIFTEAKDTLNYLADRIRTRLGKPEAVVVIHGGIRREERKQAVEAFTQDKETLIMVANDAAGEGINLQRAHLMVNYDLPWNPNRLEQRFGRIHRIGQREVCHLWNLVASETREGEVYSRLLEKLEQERKDLGGRVYDVLGRLFEARPLRELLVEAIRYEDLPEVRARLDKAVDSAVDRRHLEELLEERALARETMDASRVDEIREHMERAEARRLQPHFVRSFFLEAFEHLGGKARRREPGRWEVTHVPSAVRERASTLGARTSVPLRYERIAFEKEWRNRHARRGSSSPSEGATQIERYRGSFLGLAAGDALGTTLEFKSPGTFHSISDIVGGGPFGLKPGEWTDDTSMALCLAESLIEKRGFDPADQLGRYVRWYREGHMSATGECFDIGGATSEALHLFEKTGEPYSGSRDPNRAGNGSLMRLAPVPLFYARTPLPEHQGRKAIDAIERSGESSRTTHGTPTAVDACRYMGALIAGAIQGVDKETLLSERYSPVGSGYWDEYPLTAEIDEVAAGSFKRREPPQIRGRGYVVASLEAALWAFYRSDSFEEGCLLAVNLGEDADTTGAIYGQLAGAFYGEKGIPKPWHYRLAHRLLIEYFAERLFCLANTGEDSQRKKLRLIEASFAERFSNWGITLPPDDVRDRRRAKIIVAGWAIWYLFGSDERGEYLDYYASHRMMGGDEHTRIREDGRRESLPSISSMRFGSEDPEEDARLEAEHRQETHRVAKMLEEKGFGMEGDEPGGVQINRFLALGGEDDE